MYNKDNPRKFGRPQEKPMFDQYILDLARVTRVTEGGKHMSFRAAVVLGDRKGRVGFGLAKGKDVQLGVEKSVTQAKKSIVVVPIINGTIPHPVLSKYKAAKVLLKPAPAGSGIIAGGALRSILELAGIPNISGKILGKTKNKITIARATIKALSSFKTRKSFVTQGVAPHIAAEQLAVKPVEEEAEKPVKVKTVVKKTSSTKEKSSDKK